MVRFDLSSRVYIYVILITIMKYILLGIVGLLILGFTYTIYSRSTVTVSSQSVKMTMEDRPRRESDKVALFAGGCFWSLESYFEKIPDGMIDVVSGYSGGTGENPTYENYTNGGHREVVQVIYDPQKISYGELTEIFLRHIDPTDSGGSFYDRGANYTSAIYYENSEEKKVAQDVIAAIESADVFKKPIVTAVVPTTKFWLAEEYHQNYAQNNTLKYAAYRTGSGRDAFLKKTWESRKNPLYQK